MLICVKVKGPKFKVEKLLGVEDFAVDEAGRAAMDKVKAGKCNMNTGIV